VRQEPDKFRNNLVDQNNPDEGRQEPDKFRNNSDWSRTTQMKCIKDHAYSETTQTSIQTTRHYAAKLGGSPLPQLICWLWRYARGLGFKDKGPRIQAFKTTTTPQQHVKTLPPSSFLKKRTQRRHEGCKVHTLKEDFQTFSTRDPLASYPNKQEAQALHSLRALFLEESAYQSRRINQKETISRFPFRRTQNGFATTQQDQEE
jgi:hypothetical protein